MRLKTIVIIATVCFGLACYLVGLAQGSNRGVKGSNTASILFFTAIHRALKKGDTPRAIKLSEDAIATHAGDIESAEDHPTAALVFLYPWMGDALADNYKQILGGTYVYLKTYPQAVPRDTVTFLARYEQDYQNAKK